MPTVTARRRTGAETREEILREATALIAERGYRHMTMKAVAERVGVTEPAVYRHFPGKADLLTAVFRQVVEEAHLTMSDAAGGSVLETAPASVADMTDPGRAVLRRLIIEMYSAAALEADVAALAGDFVAGAAARLRAQLGEAARTGAIPADAPVGYTQSLVHLLMAGMAFHEIIAPELVGDPDWADFLRGAVSGLLAREFPEGGR
ncbi:MAG: TetR/AcrR family transcriptional regulator [Sphingomonadales bacterium]